MKDAQGNPGKRRRAPAADDRTQPARAAVPAELSTPAKAIWRRVADQIRPMQFVREQDREALKRYCELLAGWWKMSREIRKGGEVYWTESLHGRMKRINPAFIVRDRIEARLEAIEDRFGFTPRSRQQIMAHLAGLGQKHPGADLFGEDIAAGQSDQPSPAAPEDVDRPLGFLN